MGSAGTSGLTIEAIDLVFTKLVKALHYKHNGRILSKQGAVVIRWLTNIDFHKGSQYQFFIDSVRGIPTLVRGNRDLSNQFFYRYGLDPKADGSAFMLIFRNSLVGFGIATERPPPELNQQ